MVAVVTGAGLGLQRGSASVLGSQGQLGSAAVGQDSVTVNAANGNLVIQSVDEILIGTGPDDVITKTYNSQSASGNAWQESFQRHTGGLTGTVNTAGSTITRTASDGTTTVYTYDTSKSLYVGNEAGGAYDTLSYNSSTSKWTWQDGKTRTVEVYDNANGGRLASTADADGNSLTYTYTGSQVTKITTASGDYTFLTYTGTLLTSVAEYSASNTLLQTLTRYGYDASNRLTTVTVDLSPGDSSIADGKTYVTTYGYDGTSNRIASISQSDGSSLQITYVQIGGGYAVSTLTQAASASANQVTTFAYGTGVTSVIDPAGNTTSLFYDSNNQLVQLVAPPAVTGGTPQRIAFSYDANGNVVYSGPPGDPNFTNINQTWNDTNTMNLGASTTRTTEVDGEVPVYRRQTTTTPTAGGTMRLGQSSAGWTAVRPGQTVQLSVYAASSGASALKLYAQWRDAAGALLSSAYVGLPTGGTLGASGLATASYGTLTATVPSGAVYVELMVLATADGTSPMNVAIAQPSVWIVANTSDAGGNVVYSGPPGDPDFTNLNQYWNDTNTMNLGASTTRTTEVDGGVPVYRRQTTTTPTAGGTMRLGQSSAGWTAVRPGQTVQLSVYAASSGASSLRFYAQWRDAAGSLIGSSYVTMATGGTFGAGGVASANFGNLTATVPSGAVFVELMVSATADGTTPLNVAVAEPVTVIAGGTPAPAFVYSYDSTGNMLSKTDSLGNKTVYVYDSNNQLLTTTVYADGATPLTTRYVYDAESHLVFLLSPLGEVTQYVYNTAGQQTSVIQYTSAADLYNLTGLATSASPSSATMTSWAAAVSDLATTRRADTTYSARGAIASVTTFGQVASSGAGVASTALTTTYVYDPSGRLLQRILGGGTEYYTYDGLGRVLTSTDAYGKVTQTAYSTIATGPKAVVTLANGTTRTSTYDLAGELISETISGSGGLTGTTTYVYDADGNLIRTIDPTGVSSYFVYDDLNRKVADVAADGAVTAYIYNTNDQVVSTVAYANRLAGTPLSNLTGEAAYTATPLGLADVTPASSASDRRNWNVYDNDGRLIETIDALGDVTTFSYDGTSQLVATKAYANPLSSTTLAGFLTTPPAALVLPTADTTNDRLTRNFFDADGRLAGCLDADGYLTQTLYNDAGNKVQTIAYANVSSSTLWSAGSLSALVSDVGTSSNDIHTWFVYDNAGNLRAAIDGEGNTTRYDNYTDTGFAGKVTRGQKLNPTTLIATPPTFATLAAPSGTLEVTTYDYDEYGHVRSKTLALAGGVNETTTYTYDQTYNLLTEATNSSSSASGGADGWTSTFKYDALGRKIAALSGVGSAALSALGANPAQAAIDGVWNTYGTDFAYDASGRLVSRTDGDNDLTLFYYDGTGRLAYQVGADGEAVHYTYNAFGEQTDLTRYTKAIAMSGLTGGAVTSTLTNAINAVAATALTRHTDYDVAGDSLDNIDGNGATTTYAYNAFGEVKTSTDALSAQTSIGYNRRGLVSSSTSDSVSTGLKLKTSYSYNAFGRVKTVTDANSVARTMTYDRAGRLKTDVDGLAKTTSYTYDAFDHVVTVTDRNGKITNYAYTVFDRQVTATDATGVAVTTTQNAYGQTVKTVDAAGTATSTYNADGQLVSTTDGLGVVVVRNIYDAAGRLAFSIDAIGAVSDGQGAVTEYSYNGAGQLTQATQYANAYTASGVPSLSDIQSWRTANASGGSLSSRTAYDGAGRVAYTIDRTGLLTSFTYDGEDHVTQQVQYAKAYTTSGVKSQSTLDSWVAPGTGNVDATKDIVTRFAYDADGRLAYSIGATVYNSDGSALLISYKYDAVGNLVQQIEYATPYTASGVKDKTILDSWVGTAGNTTASDRVTRNTYDKLGRLAYTIDALGQVTGVSYDAEGRVTQTILYATPYPATLSGPQVLTDMNNWSVGKTGVATRSVYDSEGQEIYSVGATGGVTAYSYDDAGRVVMTTSYTSVFDGPAGVLAASNIQTYFSNHPSQVSLVSRSVYDTAGHLVYGIDEAGAVTAYTYNANGKITQKLEYATLNTSTGVQHLSDLQAWITTSAVTSKAADNRTSTYVYGADNRLNYTYDPLNIITRYAYDTFGRLQVEFDAYTTPDVAITWFDYNGNGQVIDQYTAYSVTGEQTVVKYTYDAFGNRKTFVDGNNNTTTYTYDACGRLLTTLTPGNAGVSANAKTVNQYNVFGDLVSVTDPKGSIGYFYYDAMGRQTWQLDAESYATQTTYDLAGQVQSVTRYSGKATFVNLNTTPDLSHIDVGYNLTSFTRDAAGRVLTSTDGNGYTTTYTYDVLGNLLTMKNALNATVSYTYDARGLMLKQSTAAGMDGSVTIAPATDTSYAYDTFGNRTQMVEGYGQAGARTTTYAYDKDNRLVTQKGDQVTVTVINGTTSLVTPTQSFTYDRRGNQVTATDANGAVTVTYYDDHNRKVAQVDALRVLTTWTYDANSNVKTQKIYATALSAAADPAVLPTGSGACRETDYTYDKDNQLTAIGVVGVETGAWSGSAWVAATGTLTTQTVYDVDGNVIKQTDANGNSSYSYYDKLGRKIMDVDAAGYITAYTLDAEGNVTSQTQYATALTSLAFGALVAGGNLPSPVASTTDDDRTTTFTYDHDGQRLTETRASYHYDKTTDTDIAGDDTVIFTYNALGQVASKTEATGDRTDYAYDTLGRVARVITAANRANAMTTQTTYDCLGNVLTTTAGFGTTTTEVTTYTYGAGGRLATTTDATGFVTTYGYDANGQTTIQSYSRLKSDGNIVQEATQTVYDALGRTVSTSRATLSGTAWVSADTADTYYNAYGEVIAQGTNTGGNIQKAQQYADYDNAGRVWRSNMDDGVTKVYGYDKNGNRTLQIQSLGTADLRASANLDAAIAASGTARTLNLYDSRNELIDVKTPTSANLDGTITSASTVVAIPNTVNVVQINYGGSTTQSYSTDVQVQLSSPQTTLLNGSGLIHVLLTSSASTPPTNLDLTSSSGGQHLSFERLTFPPSNTTQGYKFTVTVYQDGPAGSKIYFLNATDYWIAGAATTNVATQTVGYSLQLEGVNPLATGWTMYVRPTGSSGGYTALGAQLTQDISTNTSSFTCDTSQPPFNGAANTNWDVKYLATDASGNVVDAQAGTVAFNGSSVPTATGFAPIPVFTPTLSGGSYQLTTNPLPAAYSDSLQAFDAFGDVVSQTDARGNTTTFTYDRLGDLKTKSGPQVRIVDEHGSDGGGLSTPTDSYYYDISGRLVGHKDANLNLTTQDLLAGTGYGGTDALTVRQYNPDTHSIITAYDIFGNAVTETDATGAVTVNTYDLDNRLVTVTHAARVSADLAYTSGVSQLVDTYAYDGLGQRIRHSDNVLGSGVAETTDYDADGRIVRTSTFGGQVTTYAYAWTAATATTRVTAGQSSGGSWTKTTTAFGRTETASTDTFGTLLSSQDLGGHTSSFTYNQAGEVTHQSSSSGQSIDYTYTVNRQVASITDNATGMISVYGYDNTGNRTREIYYHAGTSLSYATNTVVTYDALNRVVEYRNSGKAITYSYDAVGNRRSEGDFWYTYDSMNRFVVAKGSLNSTTHTIDGGTAITYDGRGDRMSAYYFSAADYQFHTETYAYTADGYLKTVTLDGTLSAKRTTDALGRMTGYTEYKADGVTSVLSQTMTYDADNRVTSETSDTLVTSGGTTSTVHNVLTNDYRAKVGSTYTGADQGVLTHSKNVQTQNGSSVTTDTVYGYVWWTGAKSSTVTASGQTTGTTQYSYDVNGNITHLSDSAVKRDVIYQTDTFGQVLSRQETNTDSYGVAHPGAQRTFYYLNERVIGDSGNDRLDSDTDYAQELASDRNATVPQWWTSGTPVVGSNSNFDVNYAAINPTTVEQTGSSYTAMDGDTLQSIALNMWGDASLWYLIAEANGLSADATLVAGQIVTIPDKVYNLHNTSATFRPYNPNDALGNTSPTQPQPAAPKNHGCGVIGDVIAIAVATVVGVILGPLNAVAFALSDVAYQGVEMLAGNQSKFNWKEVAASFIAGAITSSIPLLTVAGPVSAAIDGMEEAAIRQGVNISVGLQKKFDWTGLAIAGVVGTTDFALRRAGIGPVTSGVASGLASALTKSVVTGQNLGKSLREVMPDVVGSTIGNLVIGGMAGETGHGTSLGKKGNSQSEMDGHSKSVGLPSAQLNNTGEVALASDDEPQITPAPNGRVIVKNLPLVLGDRVKVADAHPSTNPYDLKASFWLSPDTVELPIDGKEYYERAGASGPDGEYRTGDLYYNNVRGGYYALSDLDAELVTSFEKDPSPEVMIAAPPTSLWESTLAFVRSTANSATFNLPNYLEALSLSHDMHSFNRELERQNFLDGVAKGKAPMVYQAGTVAGGIAQVALTPELTEVRATSAIGGRLVLSEAEASANLTIHAAEVVDAGQGVSVVASHDMPVFGATPSVVAKTPARIGYDAFGHEITPEQWVAFQDTVAENPIFLSRTAFDHIPLPRSPELGEVSTTTELLQNGLIPGTQGVTLSQRTVVFSDLWKMSDAHGVEFALTKEGDIWRLYSGSVSRVRTPLDADVRVLAHTHPSGTMLPSAGDIAALNFNYDARLTVNPSAIPYPSRVIYGPGVNDYTPFWPTNR